MGRVVTVSYTHLAELSNNQTYIAFSFIYIARAFSQKKQYNKAIEYYEKAIKIFRRYPHDLLRCAVDREEKVVDGASVAVVKQPDRCV